MNPDDLSYTTPAVIGERKFLTALLSYKPVVVAVRLAHLQRKRVSPRKHDPIELDGERGEIERAVTDPQSGVVRIELV